MQIKKVIPGYADRPIGLIQSSVGGTVIEEWMSTEALEACLPAGECVSHAGCAAGTQRNSDLYYALVDPLAPMSLTGALWYQVCALPGACSWPLLVLIWLRPYSLCVD